MINDILKIIQNEDKKNPMTDEKIASMLKVNREYVTEHRRLNGVLDSRERRKSYLYSDVKQILDKNRDISDRKLTKMLNDIGYDISRFAVSQIKKNISNIASNIKSNNSIESRDYIEKNDDILEDDLSSFKEIIGYKGSLKMQVNQAKAAILYPPYGLHTLILGSSGVGKSQLAEVMYKFAIESQKLNKENPYLVFNCADYADNPQLLMAQLFGYNKGSFTGAFESKAGIVEKADGGILFLDEIHRLPSEGQEMLFYLIDKGKFRRLGETENTRKSNILLIAATTEEPESTLLLTFRRRIPMVIELPQINERPFSERYQIINYFFKEESYRINKPIKIKSDVAMALMMYDCPGNIGQIRSDIQVACARSFLNTIQSKNESMEVNLSFLPNQVKLGLLNVIRRDIRIEKYISRDITVFPEKGSKTLSKGDRYILPNDIYQFIEDRFTELKDQGLSKDNVYKIVGNQVEWELKRFASNIKPNNSVSKEKLKEIVGEKIIWAVEDAIKIANSNCKHIKENFFYAFAMHLSSAYDRVKSGKTIINPQLENVKKQYSNEYNLARKIVDTINEDLEINLTEDEVGFVAMYLKAFSADQNNKQSNVAVIVLTHGHVAKGIADVANKLLDVNVAHGIEMDLNEKPEDALLRTIELVKSVDEGKGCLILIDMGSLVTFGEIITKRTGIPTRTVGRVDTVMALEAIRRSIIPDTTLDDVAEAIDNSKPFVGYIEGIKDKYKFPKVIVTICITGEGTAIKIKKYIEDKIYGISDQFKIIPIGVFNDNQIDKQIINIKEKNNIVAFVGTIDPKADNIPFISVEEVMDGGGLVRIEEILGMNLKTKSPISKIITEDLIFANLDVKNKSDVIDIMARKLENEGYVYGDFMLSVYKREAMGITWIEGNMAIPHGSTKYVTKPAVAIATLSKPILWEGDLKTDLIFLIAFKEDSKDYMYSLYKVLKSENIMNALRTAEDPVQIKDIILQNAIPAK